MGFIGNPHENCDQDHQETRAGPDYAGDHAQRDESGQSLELSGSKNFSQPKGSNQINGKIKEN